MLLADIRDRFEEKGCSRMASADLVAALVAMTDRPWGECNHGKALTQNQLARRLKPFGIGPKTIRVDGDQLKGYEVDAFSESFARYIPPFQSVPPSQTNKINELGENQSVPRAHGGTVQNQPKSLISHDCNGGTVQNPSNGHLREKSKNSSMCDADDGQLHGLNSTIRNDGARDGWEDEI
jgi:hypothetical protein